MSPIQRMFQECPNVPNTPVGRKSECQEKKEKFLVSFILLSLPSQLSPQIQTQFSDTSKEKQEGDGFPLFI